MDFQGAFVGGLNEARVGNRKVPEGLVWRKRPDVARGLGLAKSRRRGAWVELVQNGVPHTNNNNSINLPFRRVADFSSGAFAASRALSIGPRCP